MAGTKTGAQNLQNNVLWKILGLLQAQINKQCVAQEKKSISKDFEKGLSKGKGQDKKTFCGEVHVVPGHI